ncbi:MAG: ubiquinone/menaquinone biosynthesis methyltransferase [Puniceicoccales bacterium]|jgi:demethylmenaquinone methyltransferase/2-methoxy-6-polyprenyl-1,4-benzoquinol methylase|nr:ubiquinone/menaquinone biosynthesis methyltransferase [Puniceicoccales bacterium]
MPEGPAINAMFGKIAGRYDLANTLLSGGLCHWWARQLVRQVRCTSTPNAFITDLATGSGGIALALASALPQAAIHGFDFCEPMLAKAREKLARSALDNRDRVRFLHGDCMALPLDSDSVDAITIAYGARNFQDRARGLQEFFRILRPGGSVFILEFSRPWCWFCPAYHFYNTHILPLIAHLTTGDKNAYDYLAASIKAFPGAEDFAHELQTAGFSPVRFTRHSAGIIAIHRATKPANREVVK